MSEKEPVQTIEERPEEYISEIQAVQQEARQQRQIQQLQQKLGVQQYKINEIINELNVEKQRQHKLQEVILTHVEPPEIKNPLFVYKGHEKYDWDVGQLDSTVCIEKLQNKFIPDLHQFPFLNEVNITVTTVNNVKGHLNYTLKIDDRNGERELSRRYTEFIILRSKLTQLWPGIMFCIFPNKSKIGVSQGDLIRSRSQYIYRFFRHLSRHQGIYYSEEVQTFLKNSDNINLQAYLQALPVSNPIQMFEKYKKQFPQEYQHSVKQDFLYHKEEIAVSLEEYEVYFSKKKMDLSDYLGSIIRMAESKQKYFRAYSRLNTELLADYQDTILRWIKNQPLPQSPPGIMQRLSFSHSSKNSTSNKQIPKELNESQQKKGGKEQVQLGQKRLSKQIKNTKEQARKGLLSLQAYKSRLEDTALLIHDYNGSSWKIYDLIKYQLKQIDSVMGAIQQNKAIFRQVTYLKRTIGVNKEQIEALNNNKTTMKTFFMQGNNEEKKTKLTSENQTLESQLQKMEQFYYLLMVLLQKQLKQYHLERSNFYKKSINKAFTDQIGILRSIMDFHIYEEQLFAKEFNQRLNTIRQQSNPEVDSPDNHQ